ncbi:MAG TPA: transcriptional repressor LexA [Herpetosiphonaceae bacterium]|jgi:repressor LexA|nr:transcriptional repressor LexA [Herpetosiphonaceae bacterium]
MEGLSQRQTSILEYIQRFMQESGYPPSIRDIQEKLKISSTSVVAYNLRKLEDRGLIERDNKVSRGIKMPGDSLQTAAPLGISTRRVALAGSIAAGEPIPVPDQGESEEFVEVPGEMIPERIKDVYALRVKGNSMIDALIADGDIVLMRYQETAENGQMAAVRVVDRNEVTLKRIYFEGNQIRLQPANPTMDAWYEPAANVQVQGRVVGVVRAMV